MLPQYPDTLIAIREVMGHLVRALANQAAPALGSVPTYVRHEGGRESLFRADEPDASFTEHQMEEFRVGASVTRAQIRTGGFGAVLECCTEIANQLARAQSQHFFSTLDDVTAKTGNVVNANGPVTPEILLAAYEQITIDFSRNTGEPNLPSWFFHPSQVDSFTDAFGQLHQDPELNAQYTQIINNQRMAWRDREAARRLVD